MKRISLWLYSPAIVLVVWSGLTVLNVGIPTLGRLTLAAALALHARAEVLLHQHRRHKND